MMFLHFADKKMWSTDPSGRGFREGRYLGILGDLGRSWEILGDLVGRSWEIFLGILGSPPLGRGG